MKPVTQTVVALALLLSTAAAGEALAREYDPLTGRFIQNEPIMSLRPSTHYTYGGNNPAQFTDPTGEVISIPLAAQKQFEDLLKSNGIGGFTPNNNGVSISYSGTTGALSHPATYSLNSEILFRMISSERWFMFDSMAGVQNELTLRNNIVNAAKAANWHLDSAKGGPPNCNWRPGIFKGSPAAIVDSFYAPGAKEYGIECEGSIQLIQLKGLRDTMSGPGAFDTIFAGTVDPLTQLYHFRDMVRAARLAEPSGKFKGQSLHTDSQYDWIPGDAGYIPNLADKALIKPGHEGYNILYVGGTYKTGTALLADPTSFMGGTWTGGSSFNDKFDEVHSWNQVDPILRPWRVSMNSGLVK